MIFTYMSQVQAAYKPGDRTWATGFRMAANTHKIIRNLEPTLVEFCCSQHARGSEQDLRNQGWPVACIVPVRPDGSIDPVKGYTCTGDVNFVDTEQEAWDVYRREMLEAKAAVDKTIAKLDGVKSRIDAYARKAGVDLSKA